jgi:hypothetical protein
MVKAEQEGSAFVASNGIDLNEILCVEEERVVGNDNTVVFHRLRLQIPPSPLRPHFVKARVRVRRYQDGSHAIFDGPRRIGRYDIVGTLVGEFAPPMEKPEPSALSEASRRAEGPSRTLRAAERGGLARARPYLTALPREAMDPGRSAPGNGLVGLTRKWPWRHRSTNGQRQNERPTHVLHKPDKFICYRHGIMPGLGVLGNQRLTGPPMKAPRIVQTRRPKPSKPEADKSTSLPASASTTSAVVTVRSPNDIAQTDASRRCATAATSYEAIQASPGARARHRRRPLRPSRPSKLGPAWVYARSRCVNGGLPGRWPNKCPGSAEHFWTSGGWIHNS